MYWIFVQLFHVDTFILLVCDVMINMCTSCIKFLHKTGQPMRWGNVCVVNVRSFFNNILEIFQRRWKFVNSNVFYIGKNFWGPELFIIYLYMHIFRYIINFNSFKICYLQFFFESWPENIIMFHKIPNMTTVAVFFKRSNQQIYFIIKNLIKSPRKISKDICLNLC